jgi:AcrR family transcriptional regulator
MSRSETAHSEPAAGSLGGTPRRTNAERAEGTRALLIDVARRLFGERGYVSVSTEEIVRTAEVTRGALYHHFNGKKELFKAVYEEIERKNVERIAAVAATESDPWRQQLAAVGAFLDACQEPYVQQIALIDAPSVLGWEEWHEVEERYGLGLVQAGLQLLIQANVIEEQPVEPLAHLILGALTEAGMVIAQADDPDRARKEVGEAVERLLEGLRIR